MRKLDRHFGYYQCSLCGKKKGALYGETGAIGSNCSNVLRHTAGESHLRAWLADLPVEAEKPTLAELQTCVGVYGRLGHGDQHHQRLPKKVEAFAGQRVVAVAAGRDHSFAITADGAVWSWGDGYQGRLGHGDTQSQLLPKKVEAFAGRRVVAVAAGSAHSLALTADGAFFTWGKGDDGCLGHGEDLSDQLLPKKIEAQVGAVTE